jgi:hypothetical protein
MDKRNIEIRIAQGDLYPFLFGTLTVQLHFVESSRLLYKKMNDEEETIFNYYLHQAGNGLSPIYTAPLYQQGRGVGDWLAKIYRSVIPYVKRGVKKASREFLKSGLNIIEDLENNNSTFKEVVKNRGREAFDRTFSGEGYKAKRLPIASQMVIRRQSERGKRHKVASKEKTKQNNNKKNKVLQRNIKKENTPKKGRRLDNLD